MAAGQQVAAHEGGPDRLRLFEAGPLAKLQVYISYTLAAPQTWPEGRSLAVAVLKDETLIPFHVCSDIVYSETPRRSAPLAGMLFLPALSLPPAPR